MSSPFPVQLMTGPGRDVTRGYRPDLIRLLPSGGTVNVGKTAMPVSVSLYAGFAGSRGLWIAYASRSFRPLLYGLDTRRQWIKRYTGFLWWRFGAMVDLVTAKREQILRLARRHGVTGVRVFGSMARGDAGPQSDVDLLIEVGADPSPWFPGGLIAELEELLGRRVQVVTERGLDELLRDRVLEEAVTL